MEIIDSGDFRVLLDVPFELQSMADAELDVGTTTVQLRGPPPSFEEVFARLPEGYLLDPELAAAKFSKKKDIFSINSNSTSVPKITAD